jgi:hypothetical protein
MPDSQASSPTKAPKLDTERREPSLHLKRDAASMESPIPTPLIYSQSMSDTEYSDWLARALAVADKQYKAEPKPSRKLHSIPASLIAIVNDIKFQGDRPPSYWAQWIMDMAASVAPGDLIDLIHQEAGVTRPIAQALGTTALKGLIDDM